MLDIRAMNRDEIGFAIDLAAAEGWNPGIHDVDAFYAADPHGFLIGEVDGAPVGCISAVSYPGGFGFVGFYIVAPTMRGRGHGLALWRAAMKRLAGYNVGLDGVLEQQDNYRRSGFTFSHRNVRYEYAPQRSNGVDDGVLKTIDGSLRDAVGRYDRTCFPAARDAFLDAWLALPDAAAIAWVDEGRLRGYGVIRACRQGCKIGPLFADDGAVAEGLLDGLCARAPASGPVYFDVPETNAAALGLAARRGMTAVFETARMYTGPAPEVEDTRVFGVTSFELG